MREHLAYGVNVPAGLTGDSRLHAVLTAWARVLPPDHAFTGLTAAQVHRLWLPPLPSNLPVFAAVRESTARCRRPGIRVTRHRESPAADLRGGVRIAPVPDLLLACARELGLADLVVLIDSALHLRLCKPDEIEGVATTRARGAPRLRAALELADGRSESPWETLLRLLHTVCGVSVEPQVDLFDAAGGFLARADLLVTGTRTLQEYDGAGHFDHQQYGRDRRRDSALARAGYVRHGWVASQVMRDPWAIINEAYLALGWDPASIDVLPWLDLLRESLFTREGTAALMARWAGSRGSGHQSGSRLI